MKRSRFNHLVALPAGGFALYNFLTRACLRLSFLSKDYYDSFEVYGEGNPQVRRLADLGFLVDYDELAYLRSRVRLECGDTHKLRLTICPTLECDFACPYCFERHRAGAMTQAVQDDLVAFATRTLSDYHPTSMEVTWYGGEPLLELDVIRSVSSGLIGACEKRDVRYDAGIITNGYNLDARACDVLRCARVSTIQITLDGADAATHDRTRHLRGGAGTFERILANVGQACDQFEITIRCNVHKGNAAAYPRLEERMSSLAARRGAKVDVYAGHMDAHGSFGAQALSGQEFAELRRANAHTVKRMGYNGPVCMVPKLLDVVVDERGNLYKCLEHVGRRDDAFGNVADFDFATPKGAGADVLSHCFEQAWPDDDECMGCPVLPVCMGGCPERRREGAKECSELRFLMDEYVISLCERKAGRGTR